MKNKVLEKISTLIAVATLLHGCAAGRGFLPREQRVIKQEQELSSLNSKSAYAKIRLNAAKIFSRNAITLDDANSRTLVLQLIDHPCNAFPSVGKSWDLMASLEIQVKAKVVTATFDDLIVTHSAHRNANAMAQLIQGDQRKPASHKDLDSIQEVCLDPILDRLLEGVH